ncbi:hypothetical protein HNR16_002859 [Pseudoclavibacter chungangensis]|nr:hypothetical protein [Pseudoclavibacter chungangensis]
MFGTERGPDPGVGDAATEPPPLALADYLAVLETAGYRVASITTIGGSHVVRADPIEPVTVDRRD